MAVRPLRQVLSLRIVMAIAVPFTIMAFVGIVWLFPQIEAELESRQRELAGVIGTQVQSYLSSAMIAVKAGTTITHNDELHLQHLMDASASLSALYVADGKGRVMAMGLPESSSGHKQELLNLDLSRNSLFREAIQSRHPSWSDTFLSVIGGGLSVACAVPIEGRVVIGEIQLSRLTGYLQQVSTKADLMILLIDRHGQVIADRVGRYTAQQLNISNIPLVKEELKSGAPLTGRFTFEGRSMVGSMIPVPGIDWHILVAEPIKTAFSTIQATAIMAALWLVIAITLGVVAALYSARRLSGRFEELAAQARAVAAGEEDLDWPSSNIVEIKGLSEGLQQMAGALREREKNLKERNSELVMTFETLREQIHEFELSQSKLAAEVVERKRAEEEIHLLNAQLEQRVTERTAQLEVANTSLSHARDAADAANQAKSMFLANMSHEIRTPMNAVLGLAQLLERDPSLPPAAHNKVVTIIKSGDHLLSIINDILEMSSIEAGRIEMRTESVELPALLNDLAFMFRMRAEEKGLAFTLDLAADLPRYIVADTGKLRQVLINLLGNAVKFTRAGSIVLHAFPFGSDRIAIEVKDSGIGITSEEMQKLFRPFERTRSGEQTAGGTGLGLAISRKYAHLMDGEITVTSQAGEGSCFRFEFHAQLSIAAAASSPVRRRVARIAPGQGDILVLVVDDEEIVREILRETLELLGFIVAEASDGKEAIEKAGALNPRIILMDMTMPGMGGEEATRILRSRPAGEAAIIIGITGNVFKDDKHHFLASGINAYIGKPFQLKELYDALSLHGGVLFEPEVEKEQPATLQTASLPTLGNMSPEWRVAFTESLSRNNITRIRKLGEEAKGVDPLLSAWLLERAEQYDLEGMKKLVEVSA